MRAKVKTNGNIINVEFRIGVLGTPYYTDFATGTAYKESDIELLDGPVTNGDAIGLEDFEIQFTNAFEQFWGSSKFTVENVVKNWFRECAMYFYRYGLESMKQAFINELGKK